MGKMGQGGVEMDRNETMRLLSEDMVLEIIVPPAAAFLLIVLASIIYSMVTQPKWWRSAFTSKESRYKYGTRCPHSTYTSDGNGLPSKANDNTTNSDDSQCLFTQEDLEIIHQFSIFQNNPLSLMKLAVPALLSIAFCPITIFLQPIMLDFFYPHYSEADERKNINDALAVFLLPAGLVYAMAFGFALQDSFAKLEVTTANWCHHVTLLLQTRELINCNNSLTSARKMAAFKHICRFTTHWMREEMTSGKLSASRYGAHTWRLVRMLQQGAPGSATDDKLGDTLFHKLMELDTLMMEGYRGARANITTLLWAFMELLGLIAFFGILLTVAESYRMELTMCILTVFSISAFLYILADLDYAYHGTSRVDFSMFVDFLEELNKSYEEIKRSHDAT